MTMPLEVSGRMITPTREAWLEVVSRYRQPSGWKAAWQLCNTLVPYLLLWCLMYFSVRISLWLTLPLAVLAAGFLVRTFIIFHDCVHGSFFRSRLANGIAGFVTGLLTFTPYGYWRWQHVMHHAGSGDLDRRGTGDVWTLTVQEYLESSRWRRLSYRLARNPAVLFLLAPLFMFVVMQRFAPASLRAREKRSVHWMNLALLAMAAALAAAFGMADYLIIQLTIVALAGAVGIWLFYVQHQFDGVYWERGDDWDYATAALQGSSYYQLPAVLRWFSGNIGFHHIHHLSPRIPNYNLQKCHEAEPLFRQVKVVTLLTSLKSLSLRLWDEKRKQLVGYQHLRSAPPRS